jgi:hypothetical protein
MFPVFPPTPRKAVDKGNRKQVEKPGGKRRENLAVGKATFPAQAMHPLRTPGTPFTDSLILCRSPGTALSAGIFPQAHSALNRNNQNKLLKKFFPFIFLCS